MGDRRCVDGILFEEIFDQIDTPARAVGLIAKDLVRRTDRRAEAAVHAGAQNVIGFRDQWVTREVLVNSCLHSVLRRVD
jgi:hypothetical protein